MSKQRGSQPAGARPPFSSAQGGLTPGLRGHTMPIFPCCARSQTAQMAR